MTAGNMSLNSLKGRNVIIYTVVSSTDQHEGVLRQLQNYYRGVYLGADKDFYYLDKLGTKKPNIAVKKDLVVSFQDYEAFLSEASDNTAGEGPNKDQYN